MKARRGLAQQMAIHSTVFRSLKSAFFAFYFMFLYILIPIYIVCMVFMSFSFH